MYNVYMTRHSARADNSDALWKPLPGPSMDDTHLSKDGEQQAIIELANKFDSIEVGHIVS